MTTSNEPPDGGLREEVCHPEFLEDLHHWIQTDRRVALRILTLVKIILREPFSGIGKPEPLKHQFSGAWSRRITDEHRLVYYVKPTRIEFVQALYHY